MLEHLKHEDPVIGAAAARLGELKPPNVAAALAEAYKLGQRDVTYVARGSRAVRARGLRRRRGHADADDGPGRQGLGGPRARGDAAEAVRSGDRCRHPHPARANVATRRISTRRPAWSIPPVSTQVYIETDRGTIQIELAVLDAPLTVENFVALARKGFFDGVTFHRVVADFVVQSGDPRGDGEGGPGYTIRDELNQRPYLRGAVGMALDWADTGGSQFFITHSPQPHLDARYTVFGRVISGMEIVDQIQPWDVIRRVIVWDGENLR